MSALKKQAGYCVRTAGILLKSEINNLGQILKCLIRKEETCHERLKKIVDVARSNTEFTRVCSCRATNIKPFPPVPGPADAGSV